MFPTKKFVGIVQLRCLLALLVVTWETNFSIRKIYLPAEQLYGSQSIKPAAISNRRSSGSNNCCREKRTECVLALARARVRKTKSQDRIEFSISCNSFFWNWERREGPGETWARNWNRREPRAFQKRKAKLRRRENARLHVKVS